MFCGCGPRKKKSKLKVDNKQKKSKRPVLSSRSGISQTADKPTSPKDKQGEENIQIGLNAPQVQSNSFSRTKINIVFKV